MNGFGYRLNLDCTAVRGRARSKWTVTGKKKFKERRKGKKKKLTALPVARIWMARIGCVEMDKMDNALS